MEFGSISPEAVSAIDHRLADDGESVARVLKGSPAVNGCKFHVGCGKWGEKQWLGHLYAPNALERDLLSEYAGHFDAIELNASFYSIPTLAQCEKWKQKVDEAANDSFLFVPRVSRTISHIFRLNNCEASMETYLAGIAGLGPYLGPLFVQLSTNYGPKNFPVLRSFIEKLPSDHRFFLEIREEHWFSDAIERGRLFALLSEHQVGAVISDTSGRRDCVHMELTVPELFVRFTGHGGALRPVDFKRIDEWVDRIADWIALGLEKVYFFLNQQEQMDTPVLAGYLIDQLNARFQAGLRPIHWTS